MAADPHIVAVWVKGWTLARETAPPIPYEDGFRVDVGWPQQKTRYVFAAMSPAIGELVRVIEEPWVFLKACVGGHNIPYDRGFGERFRCISASARSFPGAFPTGKSRGRGSIKQARRPRRRSPSSTARCYGRFRRPRARSRNMPMTSTRMRGCALHEIEAARLRGCKRDLPGAARYRAWKCWMSSARLPARKRRSPHRTPNSRRIVYASFWRWEEVGGASAP